MQEYSSINIRIILDNIKMHPLLQDVSLELVVNLTVQFMRLVGCSRMFKEYVDVIDIKDYKARIPCEFYKLILVRDPKTLEVYRYATDSFHLSNTHIAEPDATYKILGNYIYTNRKEGLLEIVYLAINVDDDGFPLIPDNASFIRALELYIKQYFFTIYFDLGKINANVFQLAQQDYAFAVANLLSEMHSISLDKAESLTNEWNSIISRDGDLHASGFKYMGYKEHYYKH